MPPEYVFFQFCREFKKLPHEVKEMPMAQYNTWLEFMRTESKADTIRDERERQRKLMASLSRQ